MSFPYLDPNWRDAADFVRSRVVPGETILAQDEFWRVLGDIHRYANTRVRPEQDYDWAILHKGALDGLGRAFLARVPARMKPVFANDVFVAWFRGERVEAMNLQSPHIESYHEKVAELPPEKPFEPGNEPVLSDVGRITKAALLDKASLQQAMDDFWSNGGHLYTTLRDKAYYAEIARYIVEFAGTGQGLSILDVCCGIGRLTEIFANAASVVGIDISQAAVEIARQTHREAPTFTFDAMDAEALSFADASFDMVLFIDAVEHVKDAEQALRECARVLKPGGRLLLTSANSDSLNQIIARKLGYPSFITNHLHIREFTFAEMERQLMASISLSPALAAFFSIHIGASRRSTIRCAR
jgi:SAM-dependent methyltransferase